MSAPLPWPKWNFPASRGFWVDLAGSEIAPVLMLKLYLDDSKSGGGKLAIAAGWLAPAAYWDQFEAAWRRALIWAEIPAFHSADFFSCEHDFEGLTRGVGKHKQMLRRFSALAQGFEQIGISRGIIVPVFDEMVARRPWLAIGTPNDRFTAMMMAVRMCLEYVSVRCPRPAGMKIQVVMEQGKGCGEAIEYCKSLSRREAPWMAPYGPIGMDDKSCLPLQAADLLAYESKNRLLGTLQTPEAPISAALRSLLRHGRVDMKLMHDPGAVEKALAPLDVAVERGDPAVLATLRGARPLRKTGH